MCFSPDMPQSLNWDALNLAWDMPGATWDFAAVEPQNNKNMASDNRISITLNFSEGIRAKPRCHQGLNQSGSFSGVV